MIANAKRFIFPALAVGAGIGLARQLLTVRPTARPAARGAPYEAVDAYVVAQMRRLKIPGASLAIVEGDSVVHQRGFGRARPGGDAPTPQTPFFIGSVTKSFTALAVMQLVEAGKVELDAPVQRYLPWFRVADPQASAQMTVRHLLNQTSGFSMVQSNAILADLDDRPDATERQVRALATVKISRPVGSKWEYSNLNYNILGLIVESASGQPYSDYLQAHIFEPLDMRRTYAERKLAQEHGLARGHRHWFSLPIPAPDLPVPRGSLPSGQLISCTEDLAHYLIAHLNGGRYHDEQVLSAPGIDELHRGAAEFAYGSFAAGRYAMGWFELDLDGTRTYSHSGNVPDFSAFMALIPEQQKGVVVLFNADPYGLPMITEEIGTGLTAVLAGQQPPPIRLDFIQWVMRLLPLIPLAQVAGVFATRRRLDQWRQDPAARPKGGRLWARHILLPLLPNLSLSAVLAYLTSNGLLGFMRLYMPDLAWTVRISGGFAGVWAALRTRLILRALREPTAPNVQTEDIRL
ncbi:MAG: serine hydrolase domain-containing protein [Anaerolineae bacterium]